MRDGGTDSSAHGLSALAPNPADAADPNRRTLDFSFSGMKTALLYAVRGIPPVPNRPAPRPPEPLTEQRISDLCASFQFAAVAQVTDVLGRAHERLAEAGIAPQTLLVGGGVSANRHLRAELARFGTERGIEVRLPALAYCLDNAAMIAWAGIEKLRLGLTDELNFKPRARWEIST